MKHFLLQTKLGSLLLILLLSAIAFHNSIDNQFLMDDLSYIVNNPNLDNPEFLQLGFQNPEDSPHPEMKHAYFRPVYHGFIVINHRLFGLNPRGFILTNFLCFVFIAWTFYQLIRAVFGSTALAALSTALFMLHPLNGELVNYPNVSGAFVYVAFMNLCMWMVYRLHTTDSPITGTRRQIVRLLSYLTFGVGLLSHEVGIFAFACVFFIVLIGTQKTIRQTIVIMVPYLAIAMLYILIRKTIVNEPGDFTSIFTLYELNAFSYLASVFQLILWYMAKIFFPIGIVFMWDGPIVRDPLGIAAFIGLGLLILACLFRLLIVRQHNRAISCGIWWFLALLTPVFLASISRPNYGFIIEPHWIYYSTFGALLVISALLLDWRERCPRPVFYIVIGSVLTALLFMTWQYNRMWSQPKVYLKAWVDEDPDGYLPNFWLGSLYLDDDDLARAQHHFERILQRRFVDWETYVNLGVIEHYQGNFDAALDYYQKAIGVNARCADAFNNIGVIYRERGQTGLAREYFQKAIDANPRQADAVNNLRSL